MNKKVQQIEYAQVDALCEGQEEDQKTHNISAFLSALYEVGVWSHPRSIMVRPPGGGQSKGIRLIF